MVAVAEIDEAGFLPMARVAPVVVAHLQSYLDRGGAVVGEEAAREPRWRHGDQAFGQLHGRLVGEAGQNHVLQLGELCGSFEL